MKRGGAYAGSGEGSSAACHPRHGSLFLGSHLHRHRHMSNFEKQQIYFCIPQAPLRPTKAYCFLHAAGLVKWESPPSQGFEAMACEVAEECLWGVGDTVRALPVRAASKTHLGRKVSK